MASIKFPRKEFEKHIKLNKEIEEKISLFGTHLESLTDEEIELEILPNRPDLFSFQGFIKAFKAFLGKDTGLRKYKIHQGEKNYKVKVDKSVKTIRPYTACAIVKNLSFNDEKIKEIIYLQEKLHSTLGRNRKKMAIGIYPLEKISLPIKYEARKPQDIKFIPLDSSEEKNALQILQKHPAGREFAHLLQGKDRFPVFVDAKGEILSMPPVINSSKTGKITQETRDVFIECSGFDFSALKKALNIIATMLADIGGTICQMKLYYGKNAETTPDFKPEKIKISIEHANKLLGLELKEADAKKLLERMCYNYGKGIAEVPAWRADIMHEVDIIEDIAIAYGYDKFIPEIPQISTIGGEDKKETIKRRIAEILAGLGMLETSSLHLLTKEDLRKAGAKEKEMVEVEESKTDYKFLRQNLLCPALKTLSENVDAEYPQKIFEMGVVFRKDERAETGISEKENLIVALSPRNFTDIKQAAEYLGRMLGKVFTLKEAENPNFIDGRCGKICHEGREIGIIGEIHPSLLKKWRIKMPVAAFEICIEEMI